MTNHFWRYSHLALAVSSFLFLLLACITGAILSAEPVVDRLKPYAAKNIDAVNLAQAIPVLRESYPGITKIAVESNQFVLIEGTDKAGNDVKAYVEPTTGKIIGRPTKKNEFFQWVTSLHRSLFLHETGRIFIGLTAFFLMLIAVSGIMLTIKRQRGISRFLAKIPNDGSAQYYHTVGGRLSLIFILLIAVSGTYLSLNTLGIIKPVKTNVDVDFDKIKSGPQKNIKDFESFKNIGLSQVQTIEFPFSEDVEDYYTLTLKGREVAINQVTGVIIAESKYPFSALANNLSMTIHTGRGSAIWAVILGIASLSILFFIYSGFVITIKRISSRIKNKYKKEESIYILLVGSENGTTNRYASAVLKLLIKQGKKAYITSMNDYAVYPKAEHFLIFTSTYGIGEPPANANKFLPLIDEIQQINAISYSVLGFGSKSYPDFCKFAFDVHNYLSAKSWATPLIDVHTVNDRAPEDLTLWQESWSQQSGISFEDFAGTGKEKPKSLKTFSVQSNTRFEDTFLIELKSWTKLKAKSGDLLAIYPAKDHRERLYSIGVVNKKIQLSVKLHENGLGSGFLHALNATDKLKARVVRNNHFHFPVKASSVIMISNGTGIAPFLGMLDENKDKISCYLYCGFKNTSAFEPFNEFLNTKLLEAKLIKLNVAYSREGNKQYVSDLVSIDSGLIAKKLIESSVIMICGSLSMQKDILLVLQRICRENTDHPLSFYQSRNQILTDCY
ncbi:PepSY domain-containing protein [Pedobacter sp. Leaf176]|uniref:PepSY domain-containing protein n=1 Tax=Pedobacter sp. Leaf176 TaxID=1736286 RepID=UPI0006FA66C2|nr:PepSY domain-containing protein [Pedobacter sp. Leaf176]KQR70918.1 FAD-binding oxidoreductase [Pedobacter sp. Leaf176]